MRQKSNAVTPGSSARRPQRSPSSAVSSALFQRIRESSGRLHALLDSDALCEALIEEAAQLTHAQRVLLVLIGPDGSRIGGALMPQNEDAQALLHAIMPWLLEARRTRAVVLRHGPERVSPIDQRSCLIAPLIMERE